MAWHRVSTWLIPAIIIRHALLYHKGCYSRNILFSILHCCLLTGLPASTLNPLFSKPSGQFIILLKTLRGLPIASKKLEVQPVYQGFQSSPWSGSHWLLQSFLLQLHGSPFIAFILAMGNHELFTKWASAQFPSDRSISLTISNPSFSRSNSRTSFLGKPSLITPHFLIQAYNCFIIALISVL